MAQAPIVDGMQPTTHMTPAHHTTETLLADPRLKAFERNENGWRANLRAWKVEALNHLSKLPKPSRMTHTRYDSANHRRWSESALVSHLYFHRNPTA